MRTRWGQWECGVKQQEGKRNDRRQTVTHGKQTNKQKVCKQIKHGWIKENVPIYKK